VVVNYTLTTGGTGSQALTLVSGTWQADFTAPGGGTAPSGIASYAVVATDGAGHTGSFSKTCA
ncbi:MAG: hypothetical protein HY873_01425, partial [Chloroflexi bacterium]|nr:hypothetical protein [Chloroflexota bacterium]